MRAPQIVDEQGAARQAYRCSGSVAAQAGPKRMRGSSDREQFILATNGPLSGEAEAFASQCIASKPAVVSFVVERGVSSAAE